MKTNKIVIALLAIVIITSAGCGKKENSKRNYVTIGISSDIESINPLYAFSENEGNITELLYLSLVKHDWNNATGELDSSPMLAESWEWGKDSSYIIFNLRKGVYWSDSTEVTAGDVVFSFDVYSDPDVQSKFFGSYDKMFLEKNGKINIKKTFELLSPYKLRINFVKGSIPSLFDVDMPIIPEHIFAKVNRKSFTTAEQNFKSVYDGPFLLAKWEKNQAVVLKANKNSFLFEPGSITEIVFKVIPSYKGRLTQLQSGEIDLAEGIKTEDAAGLKKNSGLQIATVSGRNYDYAGWNNIDPDVYGKTKKKVPNKLFGSAIVRTALACALNRQEVLDEYMNNYGRIAAGPVSPIFSSAYDKNIEPYAYSVQKAKELLSEDGWKDSDNDGILDKNGLKFSFTFYYPSGNPRRSFAAEVFKNNLKEIGIDAKPEPQEMGVFIGSLNKHKYNAWMAGWAIPIPMDLKLFWYSDLKEAPLNYPGFSDPEADKIIERLCGKISDAEKNILYKKFQQIIHKDQPVTFLYWVDNLTAYNKRIKNIKINPLGSVHDCWEWKVF